MQSLHLRMLTNVLLFFDAVGYRVALALPAAREVQRAEGHFVFGDETEKVGALQTVGAVAVEKEDAGLELGKRRVREEGDHKFFEVGVGDRKELVGEFEGGDEVLWVREELPAWSSE